MVVHGDSPNAKTSCYLKTLRSDEVVIDVLNEVARRQDQKYSVPQLLEDSLMREKRCSSSWYYKNTRTTPIDFGDFDVSGSSSEDESEISLDDNNYLKRAERKAILWKRSSKDSNLWRKRLCALTDKLWLIDSDRHPHPRAVSLKINAQTKIYDSVKDFEYPHCIVVSLSGSSSGTYFLRANSPEQQQIWIDELRRKATLVADNDVINMAEIIMCDEIETQTNRFHRGIDYALTSLLLKQEEDKAISETLEGLHQEEVALCTAYGSSTDKISKPAKRRPFCSLTSKTLLHRVHRSPTSSYLRKMYSNNSCGSEMLAFIMDVQRYKEIHRHDLVISPRQQWMAVLRIYHLHVLPQLQFGQKEGIGQSISQIPPITQMSSVSAKSEVPARRLLTGLLGAQSNRRFSLSRNKSRSGSISSTKSTGKKRSTTSKADAYDKGASHLVIPWEVSPGILTGVDQKIFSNITRLPFGGTGGTIDSTNGPGKSNTSSLSNSRDSSSNGGSFWSWGRAPSPPNVPEDSFIAPNPNISMFELVYGMTGANCYASEMLIRGLVPENESNYSESPIYEIIDVEIRPSLTIFDDLVEEVEGRIYANKGSSSILSTIITTSDNMPSNSLTLNDLQGVYESDISLMAHDPVKHTHSDARDFECSKESADVRGHSAISEGISQDHYFSNQCSPERHNETASDASEDKDDDIFWENGWENTNDIAKSEKTRDLIDP